MVRKLRSQGYTMVELMIVVAIMGMFVLMVPNMYKQVRRFFFLSSVKTDLQREARATMMIMTRRVRQASASTIVIDQGTSQPYYSRLSFNDVDGNYVRIYQSGKTLYFVDGGTKTLSKDLRYLAFSLPRSDDLGIISLSFTLEKSIYEGRTKALHMASERVRVMNN